MALITLALFGENASIDPNTHQKTFNRSDPAVKLCYDYPPMVSLLNGGSSSIITTSCDNNFLETGYEWVYAFTDPKIGIFALNQAAFLANQAIYRNDPPWLSNSQVLFQRIPSLKMVKPGISTSALIGLSVLIAVYLVMLIGLCVVNLMQVPWTGSLNGHAILKMTAALCSSSSLDIDQKKKTDDILDRLPGHVGDAEPDAPVGKLAVGAKAPLRWRRRYWKGNGLAL